MSQCNMTFDIEINLGHSDLYFMVQWFFCFYFLLWKKFQFYSRSAIKANYAVLRQLLTISGRIDNLKLSFRKKKQNLTYFKLSF